MAVAISDLKRAIARPLQCRRKSERTWKDSCLRAAFLENSNPEGAGRLVAWSLSCPALAWESLSDYFWAPFRRPGLFSRNQQPFPPQSLSSISSEACVHKWKITQPWVNEISLNSGDFGHQNPTQHYSDDQCSPEARVAKRLLPWMHDAWHMLRWLWNADSFKRLRWIQMYRYVQYI